METQVAVAGSDTIISLLVMANKRAQSILNDTVRLSSKLHGPRPVGEGKDTANDESVQGMLRRLNSTLSEIEGELDRHHNTIGSAKPEPPKAVGY